ncbi:MAG: hypothetical protein LH606_15635 [Cytophagaceae bacterium]|nr:hypothetical protein [Cytophagaceae bacterium]
METKRRKTRKPAAKPSAAWKVTVDPSLGKAPLPTVIQTKLDEANGTLARVGLPKIESLQNRLTEPTIDQKLDEKPGDRVLFPEDWPAPMKT